ncbi:MAG: effector-associated constant component EACC1 [Gammaproteobacteria bacterium]
MTWHGVARGSDSVLRDLILVVESEPDVDPDEVDRSARRLRAELKDLDVESVAPASSESAPPGAKGVDPSNLTALLITLSASGGVFTVLIETAWDWLTRHASARRVSVTIDGDTLVLDKASAQERSALIGAYLSRHGVN